MTQPPTPLPRAYLSMLVALHEAGGQADLDQHGRLTVGPSRHFLAGDAVAWFRIVAQGYLGGEAGKIVLTEEGRSKAEEILAGRVRQAAV